MPPATPPVTPGEGVDKLKVPPEGPRELARREAEGGEGDEWGGGGESWFSCCCWEMEAWICSWFFRISVFIRVCTQGDIPSHHTIFNTCYNSGFYSEICNVIGRDRLLHVD